jgi:hypothetical protein
MTPVAQATGVFLCSDAIVRARAQPCQQYEKAEAEKPCQCLFLFVGLILDCNLQSGV